MENKLRNVLGPKIKYYRNNLDISQENLILRLHLKGLNISQVVLSRIENQERELYDYEIYAFAEALNVSINDLFQNVVN